MSALIRERAVLLSADKTVRILAELVPPAFASEHAVAPLALEDHVLRVGMAHPDDAACILDLEFITGKTVVPVPISRRALNAKLRELYGEVCPEDDGRGRRSEVRGPESEVGGPRDDGRGEFEAIAKSDVNESGQKQSRDREWDDVSIVSMVNQIITQAIDRRASDIHVEAYESSFRVRYRVDGVLRTVHTPPPHQKRAIVSRIKIMADLDIAEKRRPQDGRIRVRRGDQAIDLRVSTLPTDFGEKVVMRILDKRQLNLDLDTLGFNPDILSAYKKILSVPYGMILVTGPTGSGKTTTLYATLNHINASEVNIQTIEDPIEYNLEGINQSQVKSDIGYTFASALRSFLRQDPDIIMVGEIRDQETAEMAIRSSLTGHLVLSTLHTNNAPDTLTRLLDMGQEPFLISSSVRWVMAQRLLRVLCPQCKRLDTRKESRQKLQELNLKVPMPKKLFMAEGCDHCGNIGYKGRTAVIEALPITDRIADAINHRATARELRDLALSEGMVTLQMHAMEKLAQGITGVDEVLRSVNVQCQSPKSQKGEKK